MASMDVEHVARAFPSPKDSKPVRSVTYHCGDHIYQAVIGQRRSKCDDWGRGDGLRPARLGRRASGRAVLSIVATSRAVEIWSREPATDWPNPSLIGYDAIVGIEYLDKPEATCHIPAGWLFRDDSADEPCGSSMDMLIRILDCDGLNCS